MENWKIKSLLVQGSQEWHEFRRTRIGASDIPIIMGLSPWSNPLKLWKQKMNIVESDFENYSMLHGKRTEEEARKEFELMTGIKVEPAVVVHPKYPFLMASLDGAYWNNGQIENLVELKCPTNSSIFEMAKTGRLTDYYYAQVQAQLGCCGLEWGYFAVYYGKEMALVEVERNDEYLEKIYEAAIDFYRRMQEFDPPEDTIVHRDDFAWSEITERLKYAHHQLKTWGDAYDSAKKELIELAKTKSSEGFGVRLTYSVRKGNVQYKDIPALKGLDLEQFRGKHSEVWTVNVNEKYA